MYRPPQTIASQGQVEPRGDDQPRETDGQKPDRDRRVDHPVQARPGRNPIKEARRHSADPGPVCEQVNRCQHACSQADPLMQLEPGQVEQERDQKRGKQPNVYEPLGFLTLDHLTISIVRFRPLG